MISWKRLCPLDSDLVREEPFASLPVRENFFDFGKKLDGLISPLEGLSSSELPPLYWGSSSSLLSMTIGLIAGREAIAEYGALNDVPAGAMTDANLPAFGADDT